jgi:hypothetical protein
VALVSLGKVRGIASELTGRTGQQQLTHRLVNVSTVLQIETKLDKAERQKRQGEIEEKTAEGQICENLDAAA